MIYLDHNATTRCDERVLEAMLPYLGAMYGNPSSLYKLGRISRSAINTAREQLASLVGVSSAQIIFTSGGSEANALALAQARGGAITVSAIEHPSVFEQVRRYRHAYREVQILPVAETGVVQLESVDALRCQAGDYLSLMLANNETGAIQPVADIAERLAARGVYVHTDAVQALGKIPLSFTDLGVRLMSLSSHKIYGPKGCGALVVAENAVLQPMLVGGDQESGWRAGTENVAAIVGFGKAAELAKAVLEQRVLHLRTLRDYLERQLHSILGLEIFAEQASRLPNTVQFSIPNVSGEMLLMRLDQRNIAVSSGSACAVGHEEISPVLAAMAVDPVRAKAAIRVSLGDDNTPHDIDELIAALKAVLENDRENAI